jgi:hypothetical protein
MVYPPNGTYISAKKHLFSNFKSFLPFLILSGKYPHHFTLDQSATFSSIIKKGKFQRLQSTG